MANLDEFFPVASSLHLVNEGQAGAFKLLLEEGDKIVGMDGWRITPDHHGFVIATAQGRLYLLSFGTAGILAVSGPLEFQFIEPG